MKKRILCFGDSNTWGYNGVNGERFDDDERWTSRLQKKLGDEYIVIEEGLNGRTTVWYDPVEHVMSGIDYLWPCLKTHCPLDLVIIMLGCNDCKKLYSANPWSIGMGAGRCAEMAMKSPFGRNGKAPEVLLMAPLHIGDYLEDCQHMYNIFGPDAPETSKQLAKYYREQADTLGCHFADASEFASTGPDAIHMDYKHLDGFAESMKKEILKIV